MVVKRFDVYLINLDPTAGSEIKKPGHVLQFHPMKWTAVSQQWLLRQWLQKGAGAQKAVLSVLAEMFAE